MKKKILLLLSILILSSTFSIANSRTASNPDLVEAIKLYKAGNYSECYTQLDNVIKNDPANALAYYYKAISAAQLGRSEEAISNYEKTLSLTPGNNNLSRYAKKGKRCLETPDKCEDSLFESLDDEFIQSGFKNKFSKEAKSEYERLKIEQLMRDINRDDSIEPQRFKEYKDFSNVPTNDEIVAALRTLQNAGFTNLFNHNSYSDLSVLTGGTQQNAMLNLMGGSSSMNPQLIQALLTNNMAQGF